MSLPRLVPTLSLDFFWADPMTNFWEGRRKPDGSLTDDMPVGVQEPGAVVPWLAGVLHNPETALDWLDYLSRFPDAPFLPTGTWPSQIMRPFNMKWMKLGTSGLSWLDIWVFFCLARRVPLPLAVRGFCGGWDLAEEFAVRRVRFGL